ncbi:MAG TPA: 4Fe-4S binding protein [Polyangia bacterium]
MQPERAPLSKIFNVPFLSLDGTSVEMASLLFLFLMVIVISSVKRHRQWIRRGVQVLSFFVFFYVVYSCLGVFGMIRNGLYGLTLVGSAYSESFYWLALPMVIIAVTLLHGPVFCGWICPTGSVQDLSGWLRRRLPRRPGGLSRGLQVGIAVASVGFVALLIGLGVKKKLFVEDSSLHWGAMLLLLCCLVLAGVLDDIPTRRLRVFSLVAILFTAVSHMVVTSPVHFAFTSRDDPASAITTLVILVAGTFVLRSWCRYLCPWGQLLGFLHRFSRLRILLDKSKCNQCGVCDARCDVAAIEKGVVRVAHCQFCHACVDYCQSSALTVVDVWSLREKQAQEKARAKAAISGESPSA